MLESMSLNSPDSTFSIFADLRGVAKDDLTAVALFIVKDVSSSAVYFAELF